MRPAYVRVFDYPNGYVGNFHRHRIAQLVYPVRGVASVTTDHGEWIASPSQGTVIPPWIAHRVSADGNALLHCLFVDPHAYPQAMRALTMVSVTPLLHELIKEAGRYFVDYEEDSTAERIIRLIIELLDTQRTSSNAWLPVISNDRIRQAVTDTPTGYLRTAGVAAGAAYSVRQFSRIFKNDTGMSFKDWRAIYQVQTGMRLLARNASVTDVATALGFSSSSAFIHLFRRHTGMTPSLIRQASAQFTSTFE